MSVGNICFIKEFVIVGFPGLLPHYYGLVSVLLFFVYVFTLVGNAVFLALFVITKSLQKPVYYCIINLVVCHVLFSTTTLPKIISRYRFQDGTISFMGCFLQMFFVHYFGSVTARLLAVMDIDRYAAICFPLHTAGLSCCNFLGSWLLGLIGPLMMTIRAYPLPYCASNSIVHFYSDHIAITTLACTDREEYSYPAFIHAMIVLLGSLAVIFFSYCAIIVAVLRISSAQGWMKTFSTCSPQCFNYLSSNINIKFSTDFLLPPMINLLIYCLRTDEVKKGYIYINTETYFYFAAFNYSNVQS
uniref:G-protein coupled receptors family 1 profile domain-containing protein n=1 Tax=Sinocyclocheilus grahami TaxID=75366 RepID=A0A672Q787_SINGR